ncbi:DUF945 family protein [Halomonas sp. M20]|uniref:DUF945 family protein n=1 Tax=Halomonas sp. M20 TaxID=2763264 RepID=UPI001D0B5AC9|nr:DUF945 family protein [Halomonas sp. M20]
MRKIWLAVAIFIVLGAGYLGAQAYSSHVFERELAKALENLRSNQQWQIEREAIERGWFHSSGRLKITPVDEQAWWISTPYVARHGLLSTRLKGILQGQQPSVETDVDNPLKDDPRQEASALFGDMLDSPAPRWTTTFHTLDRRADGRVDISPFELLQDGKRLSSEGASVTFEGHADDIRLEGTIAPLELQSEEEALVTSALTFNSRYQVAGNGDTLFQRSAFHLERLEYRGRQQAPITLLGLSYEGESQLDDQLRVDASLALDEAQLAGEAVLSGRLKATLERLNGAAIRRLKAQFADLVEKQGGDFWSLDDAQRKVLVQRLEPALLATLVDSPRFTLEGITLQSPLFGVDVRGSGELVFEGDDSQTLNIDDLLNGNAQAWRERLNGAFSWQGVPPLMALQLGLSPDTRQIDVQVEQGKVLIEGQPLPPLF